MTHYYPVINPQGIYAAKLPEEPTTQRPNSTDSALSYDYIEWDRYQQALASALKPENMIRFEDQDRTEKILLGEWSWGKKLEDGIQKLSEGYEIVIQQHWETRQVAILRKIEEKKRFNNLRLKSSPLDSSTDNLTISIKLVSQLSKAIKNTEYKKISSYNRALEDAIEIIEGYESGMPAEFLVKEIRKIKITR